MQNKEFGKNKKAEMCHLYTIKNKNGMVAEISDFGATLVNLIFDDKDLVLGFDKTSDYEMENSPYFGATIGRNANRISGAYVHINRIKYELDKNEGENNLHSGKNCFAFRKWDLIDHEENAISFSLDSEDMDQGLPGNMKILVKYSLSSANELLITYEAISDKDSVCNLTNHSYFNVGGHASGDVLDQILWLAAENYTPIDENSIPTGEILPVASTVFDFREQAKISDRLDFNEPAFKYTIAYDHNFVFNNEGKFSKLASIFSPKSKILMEVYSDLPGIQIYTGNYLAGLPGKEGAIYHRHQGICFETQFFPDATKHSSWPSPIIKANTKWTSKTAYKFAVLPA